MNIPEKILVLNQEYKIILVDSIEDEEIGTCRGMTYSDSKEIHIVNNMSESATHTVLLHEIIHALCDEYDIRLDSNVEELVASHLSMGIINLFVDNKLLHTCINKNIKNRAETKKKYLT